MSRLLFLSLVIAMLAVTGCAGSRPATQTAKAPEVGALGDARAEFQRKLAERMKEEEEIFDVFSRRMDEYQDLLDICDHISPAAEDSELRASCALRLRDMRQDLSELSELLRDGQ